MSMYYIRCKTTQGHRYRMRAAEDARAEKILYWLAITVLPFIGAAVMMAVWVRGA